MLCTRWAGRPSPASLRRRGGEYSSTLGARREEEAGAAGSQVPTSQQQLAGPVRYFWDAATHLFGKVSSFGPGRLF
eukprot:SAG25_NODE_425_length_8162_cov_5.814089_2_plen_76_part_00